MMGGRRIAPAALAVVLGAGLAACDGQAPQPPDAGVATRPNVLLYVVDTLRADYLGVYGNDRVRTPHVDRLAEAGVVYTHVYANSSWTRPSMASLLTGLYPTRHGTNGRADALPPDVTTLAEQLREHGYATAFVTANPNVGSFFGFARGFDAIFEMYARRSAGPVHQKELTTPSDEVTRQTLAWIDAVEPPFFAVALSIDPHEPLVPPARFDVYGASRIPYREVLRRQDRAGNTPAVLERVSALYAAEVSFTDDSFGALVEGLRSRGLLRDTLVIFTADHGEELGEYGRIGHGLSLADPVLRVPLVLSLPASERLRAGERIDEVAELVDLVPSVLDLLELPVPPGLDGRSLVSGSGPRPALATLRLGERRLSAAVAPPWKLLHDIGADSFELYDLEAGEARVATRDDAAARERLRVALRRLGRERPGVAPPEGTPPESTTEALRALGYAD